MIVLYVFGIPIVAFIVLYNNRKELHDIETRRKYSFLYAVRCEFQLDCEHNGQLLFRLALGHMLWKYYVLNLSCCVLADSNLSRSSYSFPNCDWQGYQIGNAESQDDDDKSWYYWELVVVSRKIAIIIISVRM